MTTTATTILYHQLELILFNALVTYSNLAMQLFFSIFLNSSVISFNSCNRFVCDSVLNAKILFYSLLFDWMILRLYESIISIAKCICFRCSYYWWLFWFDFILYNILLFAIDIIGSKWWLCCCWFVEFILSRIILKVAIPSVYHTPIYTNP